MRPLIALASIPLLTLAAHAAPKGGGGSGGGALSGVSAGIGGASGSGGYGGPNKGDGNARRGDTHDIADVCFDRTGRVVDEHGVDECYTPRVNHHGNAVLVKRKARVEPPAPPAYVYFYAGAQKVHDSDGSGTIDLLVTDHRFLIHGTLSRYFEGQPGPDLTMMLPTLTGGVRTGDDTTVVSFEGGVAHVRTNNDRMGDSKLTGAIAGMRVEHALVPSFTLVGEVQQMWFDHDIRATGGRIGARYKYVEAGFRVLDFNVGPALYGPEVGVRF